MKDIVFESVLAELPIDATNVSIKVEYSYDLPNLGTHKSSVSRFFPSKASATFKREVSKMDATLKKFDNEMRQTMTAFKSLEDSVHRRVSKLEKRDG
jgi:hypothetical protein